MSNEAIAVSEFEVPASTLATQRMASRLGLSVAWRSALNSLVIAAGDAVALALALALAGLARRHFLGAAVLPYWWYFLLIPGWWAMAVLGGLLPSWGISSVDLLRKLTLNLTSAFGLAAVVLFFSKTGDSTSRIALGMAFVLALGAVPAARMVTRILLTRWGIYGMEVVVFGREAAASAVIERLREESGLGFRPIGVCTDDPVMEVAELPVLGGLEQNKPLAVGAIVVRAGLERTERTALLELALGRYRHVVVLPDLGDVPSLWVSPVDVGGMVGLSISQHLFNPMISGTKRAVDLLLVAGTSPLWMPLCWVLWLAIWLEDRYSAVYRQARVGYGGRKFHAYKFRTMVPDAEGVLQRKLAEDPVLRAEWEANFKLRVDPRITRVGALLRKTSLDELPQLMNVLCGEMSLVGPRPLPTYHHEKLPEAVRELRHRVRPGLTGLWQVSGRSDAGHAGMVRWDPYYVRNWSPWLDIVILVRTVRTVLLGSGAR